jgi:hypothetical protein
VSGSCAEEWDATQLVDIAQASIATEKKQRASQIM